MASHTTHDTDRQKAKKAVDEAMQIIILTNGGASRVKQKIIIMKVYLSLLLFKHFHWNNLKVYTRYTTHSNSTIIQHTGSDDADDTSHLLVQRVVHTQRVDKRTS